MEGVLTMRQFICLSNAVRLMALGVCLMALAQPQLVMGQGILVPSDAMYDYLLTINEDGLAVDPTADSNFQVISDPMDASASVAIWPFPQVPPMTVNGVIRDTGAPAQLEWRQAPGPFSYGGVGGITGGTDPLVHSQLGFTETDLDGQKLSQYFRTEFTTTQDETSILLDVLIDDAAVFYLDGTEVARYNCCDGETNGVGAPFFDSVANGNGDVGNETIRNNNWDPPFVAGTPNEVDLSNLGGTLLAGDHVLGISAHSYGSWTSSDLGLDVVLFTVSTDFEFQGPSGSWTNVANWTSGVITPNAADAIANLLQMPTEETTIYHNGGITMGQLFIDNANKYAIAGLGTFTFETSGDDAVIDVAQGNHEFQAPVALLNNTNVNVAPGAILEFNNDVNGNGNSLTVTGGGEVKFNHATTDLMVAMAAGAMTGGGSVGGDLINSGAVLSPGDGVGMMSVMGNFSQGIDGVLAIELAGSDNYDLLDIQGSAEFGGALDVSLLGGFQPSLGDEFDILNFSSASGSFDTMSLPELGDGLQWDMSNLYAAGNLTVVPEPAGILLLVCGSFVFGFIRRRS